MKLIHCCNCLDCCSWRFNPLVLLQLPTLSFLVSPLATIPALPNKIGVVCPRVSFRLTVPFLPFLHFPFVPFTCPMCIGADVSGVVCRPRPSKQACLQGRVPHCASSHLLPSGTWVEVPLKSAAVRFPPLPSCSSLRTRHAFNPKRRGTKDTSKA